MKQENLFILQPTKDLLTDPSFQMRGRKRVGFDNVLSSALVSSDRWLNELCLTPLYCHILDKIAIKILQETTFTEL